MSNTETGIYEIKNLVNGKRYVGSAVRFGNRWRVHAQSLVRGDHHSIALQRAWRHYGPSAFQFNKLLACSKENLIMYEQICMDALKPEYNIAPVAGSQLGFKHPPEARAKMSEAAKRTRNFTGKTHSAESRAKISANRMGKGGGPMGAERRAKIGIAHKGRVITEEQRAKISATLTGTSTGRGKLDKDQVLKVRALWSQGLRKVEIARQLGIKPQWVNTVVDGHGYGWVK